MCTCLFLLLQSLASAGPAVTPHRPLTSPSPDPHSNENEEEEEIVLLDDDTEAPVESVTDPCSVHTLCREDSTASDPAADSEDAVGAEESSNDGLLHLSSTAGMLGECTLLFSYSGNGRLIFTFAAVLYSDQFGCSKPKGSLTTF